MIFDDCGDPQIGWATPDFELKVGTYDGNGIGDDTESWGADGQRKLLWHGGERDWNTSWAAGDIIGVAADLDTEGKGSLWFGKNGDWSVAFDSITAPKGLYPAMSLKNSTKVAVNLVRGPHPPCLIIKKGD